MKKIVSKHPLVIRWMHWINFPVLAVMIWSGLLIYWANDVYKIHLGHTVLFGFFPESFYRTLNISYRLAEGMAFHFVFMWIFFLNGAAYVLYTFFSGEWRYLIPDRNSFREAVAVTLHDLHLRKTAPPQLKYNGAQKIAYTAIIVMGLGSVLTGLAIYKPAQFSWLVTGFGGYGNARVIHFVLTVGYCVFFMIHVIQVILAGWNNFRAMVTGFEVVNKPPATALLDPAMPSSLPGSVMPPSSAIIDPPPPSPPPIPGQPSSATLLQPATPTPKTITPTNHE